MTVKTFFKKQVYLKGIDFVDPDGLVKRVEILFRVPAFVVEDEKEAGHQLEDLRHQDGRSLEEHVAAPDKKTTQ